MHPRSLTAAGVVCWCGGVLGGGVRGWLGCSWCAAAGGSAGGGFAHVFCRIRAGALRSHKSHAIPSWAFQIVTLNRWNSKVSEVCEGKPPGELHARFLRVCRAPDL